jgi:hypothetical protein
MNVSEEEKLGDKKNFDLCEDSRKGNVLRQYGFVTGL